MDRTDAYVPGPLDEWQRRRPEELGMSAAALEAAATFATAHETSWPRELTRAMQEFNAGEGAHGEIIGPLLDRGGVNGLVVRGGAIVHEWGETARVEMTYSASKSYLATLAGLALDRGLIRDLDERVRTSVDDGGFDGPHNGAITWRHLLQQTSEWEGTLFGKPDQVDRNRNVAAGSRNAEKGSFRALQPPGTHWEYNDVRVNRLALALLHVWRRPLPEVLKTEIMDPIGASASWRWHGYRNSFVTINGEEMQSVSGGGHWGGGLFINSRDHARMGLLHLRRGLWGERRLLSDRWLETATTPCAVNPGYGCMWWLNTGQARFPAASPASFFALGARDNVVWVEPAHDLVVVVRWIAPGALPGFVERVIAAVTAPV